MTSPGISEETSDTTNSSQLSLLDESAEEELSFSDSSVSIVDSSGFGAMGELVGAQGYLWVPLQAPGPAYRGRLGLYIEESIEKELDDRGALAPGIQSSTGLDGSLSDQLYRARLLEMRGLALGIPDLAGISNLGRALDAEDSAVLRWWIAATSDRPVRLVICSNNTKLRVYPSPVFFESLFEVAPADVTPRPPHEGMAQSSQTMELSDLPPAVRLDEETSLLGTELDSFEEHESCDVDLSDLDAALGLTPPKMPTEQLDLGYQGDEPSRPDNGSFVEGPVEVEVDSNRSPQSGVLQSELEAEDDSGAKSIVSSETAQSRSPGEEFDTEIDNAPAEAPDEVVLGEQYDSTSNEASDDQLDDLDADDFLRTLAEDSSKAPFVQEVDQNPKPPANEQSEQGSDLLGPEEPSLVDGPAEMMGASEGSSAPEKATRRPFVRLAEEREVAPIDNPASAYEEPQTVAPVVPPSDSADDPCPEPENEAKSESNPVATKPGAPDPEDSFNQLASRQWKSWVKNLESARGPKPLSVIERMFVTDYTRLKEAVRRKVADPSAEGILAEWRESFTTSYSDAFDALRVRGKRPTMVLDLPELAARLGRLQGASRVQLLLVDGMRFDLGLMIQERMRNRAEASLTERLLLWSALPSVTSYQLELLGKGPDGLKEPPAADEAEALVARGRAAATPRRVRTGALELLKLDIVQDALRQPGGPIMDRLDGIADATAAALLGHLQKLPPRTMVVVFGDHGFALDPKAAGTTEEVLQGGASPEEVLVPAFAWLTGAVH